jgi:hypothetical protein
MEHGKLVEAAIVTAAKAGWTAKVSLAVAVLSLIISAFGLYHTWFVAK